MFRRCFIWPVELLTAHVLLVAEFVEAADKDSNGQVSAVTTLHVTDLVGCEVEREEVQAFFLTKQEILSAEHFKALIHQFQTKAQASQASTVKVRVAVLFNSIDANQSKTLCTDELADFISFGDYDEETKQFLSDCDRNQSGNVCVPELQVHFESRLASMEPQAFWKYLQECESRAKTVGRHQVLGSQNSPSDKQKPARTEAVKSESNPTSTPMLATGDSKVSGNGSSTKANIGGTSIRGGGPFQTILP